MIRVQREDFDIGVELDRLAACHFLIDWLKTDAPFWKSEETPKGERWVASRAEDDAAKERWEGMRERRSATDSRSG